MGKPNPECFLLASRKLMIKPSEILVGEDSINGMLAGQRGNFKVQY
jgi:HAD superfamily hydrolase (TIGR01509 family)